MSFLFWSDMVTDLEQCVSSVCLHVLNYLYVITYFQKTGQNVEGGANLSVVSTEELMKNKESYEKKVIIFYN